MTEEPFRPLVRTQSDLEQMWRRLMSPLGFSSHTLWMVVIEDDRPVPQIIEIVEAAEASRSRRTPSRSRGSSSTSLSPGCASRSSARGPEAADPTPATGPGRERSHEAGRRSGAAVDVVHLAHDHDVLPIAVDDLLAEPA